MQLRYLQTLGNIASGWSLTFTTLSPVNQVADLLVTANSSAPTVLVGSPVTNTFNLSNGGPNNVDIVRRDAVITHKMPAHHVAVDDDQRSAIA